MKCENCGAENFDGVNFCDKCGTQFAGSNKTKKKPIIIIAIVAVIAITIAIVLSIQSGITNPLEHHLQLGYKYLQEGKYEEAILAFDKAIGIDDKNTEARFGKIEAYIALGETEKAEEVLSELSKILPSDDTEQIKQIKKYYEQLEKNIVIEDIYEIDNGNEIQGVKALMDERILWEYKSKKPGTQYGHVSQSFVEDDTVYICGDIGEGISSGITAIDKYTGAIIWSADTKNVYLGGCSMMTSDEKNIYATSTNGSDFAIISKIGNVLHEEYGVEDDVSEIISIEVEDDTLLMEYSGFEKDGIKRIDISEYCD